ncbi:MAG: aconitase X catalytic domain-containing protein [Thermoproteota archaeon]|nr:aconitase X catalytic domain-containing protein [Thermoproteota archaeon]
MQLTLEEQNGLDGRYGSTLAAAYKILVAIGEATEANRLIDIQWAHLSGVNYNTIGDAGVQFLEDFSREARVKVKTTINPMGFDRMVSHGLPQNFVTKQTSIVNSYQRMGVTPSFTCIPYELFWVPKNSYVSFAESNAAIFSNSVLNLLTNKESALSALASSITGKAPYSGLRVEEQRQANISIRPYLQPKTELDWGLLGYFAGKTVGEDCIDFDGIVQPGLLSIKSLSAAMGTSGSCGMFTVGRNKESELIDYEPNDAMSAKDELNSAEEGDLIVLGSPQLGLNDLNYLAELLNDKKFTKECMIFCAREAHSIASTTGVINRLEKSGCTFLCDSCSCLTPLVDRKETESAITNSIKAAYYLNHFNNVKVCLKDLKTIVDEYSD